MSNDIECPYCGCKDEFCTDDGAEEDQRYEQECSSCEKTYVVSPYYIRGFHEYKSDCLNGGTEHSAVATRFRGATVTKYCEDCGARISSEAFHI